MNFASHNLWYSHPAENWNQALPLGNGRIGAMVFGGVAEEKLSLNEDTLWTGYPSFHANPTAYDTWKKAQALVREHKYFEANTLLSTEFSSTPSQKYLPLGDLELTFDHPDFSDYSRTLNLAEALHTTQYTYGGVTYTRKTCVSNPDQVLAMHLTASEAAYISFTVSFASQLQHSVSTDGSDTLRVTGICPSTTIERGLGQDKAVFVYSDNDAEKGIRFVCLVKVAAEGGCVCTADGRITVKNADAATVYFTVRTAFNGWDKHPVLEGKPYIEPCTDDMAAAFAKGYDAIAADCIADHAVLYNRTELTLDGSGDEGTLPTDERLVRHQEGGDDPALYSLLFHYGRYLTIAGSRPGTQPTNLQGIWNHHLDAPWNSNYTININTEMNYWPTLMTNLSECYEPMLDLIREIAVSGARTAREYYHARGFCSHHNTDLWRLSTPVGNGSPGCAVYSFWPMSAGWFMRHLCEYYEYTMDEQWLRDVGYPLIRDCALFYSDVLCEDSDGYLSFSPSTSPEHSFFISEKDCAAVTETTTMTTSIIRDVFTMFLRFADRFGEDAALAEVIGAQLLRLRPYELLPDGALMEWSEDLPTTEPHHRHLSHLYAMHPGREITLEDTPDLAAAVRQTLINRGDDGTGWSLGWKVNFWARLREGDHALGLIDLQLRMVTDAGINYGLAGGSYPNLFDAHPPFQIDGNFGVCAGIAEMLLQGDAEHPIILPALPASWKSGSVRGLKLRGNKTVDITWKDGRATEVVIA